MDISNFEQFLKNNAINVIEGGKTALGTYAIIPKTRLSSTANRLNSTWIRAQYIVLEESQTEEDAIIDLDRWKKLSIRSEQYFIINIISKGWQVFDKVGNYVGDESFFVRKNQSVIANNKDSYRYAKYIRAIQTKPFVLLAGISGTGKSRIVQEFAFKSCPKYLQDEKGVTPGNYCMIEVKPNWHDSTELLGYYSNLNGTYQFKKFVKFLIKASLYPDVPFFVCLDEMNLAPVEQYFAEILSILETRKHPKDEMTGEVDMSKISTQPIIEAQYFKNLGKIVISKNMVDGQPYSSDLSDLEIYKKLHGITEQISVDSRVEGRYELVKKGLTLPDNVIIIGTVNMDDTTHHFSRKVIDRAMTIEMNGGNLADMYGRSSDLEYIKDETKQREWQNSFIQRYVTADEVLLTHPEYANDIKRLLPARLEKINETMKGTPFEVSYRVLNELTIMVGVMLDGNKENLNIENIVNQAVNDILVMKILPRIEGDEDMFAMPKRLKKKINYSNRLEWLKDIVTQIVTEDAENVDEAFGVDEDRESSSDSTNDAKTNYLMTAREKIQEMTDRLEDNGFTRFWP